MIRLFKCKVKKDSCVNPLIPRGLLTKLFITGINGFIGGHIAREAQCRGYAVSGMDIKAGEGDLPEVTISDITDANAVEDAMLASKPDYVLHYAAITASVEFKRDMARCLRINICGFINAIDSALKSGCKKFVYASSSAVYADSFSEDSRIDISTQSNYYARAKFMCELIAESHARQHPAMKVVGIRHFNTYGPMGAEKGEYANLINTFIMSKLNREPLIIYGDGSQSRDNIYVGDAVKLVLEVTEKADRGVYNAGSGQSTSFKRLAELIDKGNIRYVESPIPSQEYQHYTKADMGKTLALIGGFEFTDIGTGIAKTLEYYERKAARS